MKEINEEKIDKLSIYVAENFGSLKTELKNIADHLARLNGSVAKHEDKIGSLTLSANTQEGRINNVVSWRMWLMPTMSAILAGLAVYIVTHN